MLRKPDFKLFTLCPTFGACFLLNSILKNVRKLRRDKIRVLIRFILIVYFFFALTFLQYSIHRSEKLPERWCMAILTCLFFIYLFNIIFLENKTQPSYDFINLSFFILLALIIILVPKTPLVKVIVNAAPIKSKWHIRILQLLQEPSFLFYKNCLLLIICMLLLPFYS